MSARKRDALLAVDDPVVERQREREHLAQRDAALVLPRLTADRPDREDRRLPGRQDGRARIHAEHADVGDRDRSAAEVGGRRPPGARGRRRAAGSRPATPPSVSASASRMTGTSSPRGVAAAMPRWTYSVCTISFARVVPAGVDRGRAAHGEQQRLRDDGEEAGPGLGELGLRPQARRPARLVGVTSTVRNTVAWGAPNALRTIASAVALRTPRIGMRVSRDPSPLGDACGAPAGATPRSGERLHVAARDQPAFAGARHRRPGRRRARGRTCGRAESPAAARRAPPVPAAGAAALRGHLPTAGAACGRRRDAAAAGRHRCDASPGRARRAGRSRDSGRAPYPTRVGSRSSRAPHPRPTVSAVAAAAPRAPAASTSNATSGSPTATVTPGLDEEPGHAAVVRRRQLDERLRRLDLGDDLVELHGVADGDLPASRAPTR